MDKTHGFKNRTGSAGSTGWIGDRCLIQSGFLKKSENLKKWLKLGNQRFNQLNRVPLWLNWLWAGSAISKTHRNLKSQISNHKRWRWRSWSWEWKIKNKRRWRSWSWEQNIKNNMTWEESFRLHDERKWAERGTLRLGKKRWRKSVWDLRRNLLDKKEKRESQVQLYVGIWSVKSGTFLKGSYFANTTTHLFIYINATINFFSLLLLFF